MRTKESPDNKEEKFAICIIKKRFRRSTSMSSEENVGQGFENRMKIVIVKVRNDETTTVDNDVELETPPS